MNSYYDFHIHTALNPCGDDDMTPNNIVGMAALKGLNAIAITDHNTVGNVRPAMEVGRQAGLLVIPGMEIETEEEVHVLSLFSTVDGAERAAAAVRDALPPIVNKPDIFGNQLLLNERDEVCGREEQMLITAAGLNIYEVFDLVRACGGIALPAHVDRQSYSVLSNLGLLPEDLSIPALELSRQVGDAEAFFNHHRLGQFPVLHNSDAHRLGDISEREHFVPFFDQNVKNFLQNLDIFFSNSRR